MPTHRSDASKEVNDAHRRRRRQHRPKTGKIFFRNADQLPSLAKN